MKNPIHSEPLHFTYTESIEYGYLQHTPTELIHWSECVIARFGISSAKKGRRFIGLRTRNIGIRLFWK